jgi:hypothetical protein
VHRALVLCIKRKRAATDHGADYQTHQEFHRFPFRPSCSSLRGLPECHGWE